MKLAECKHRGVVYKHSDGTPCILYGVESPIYPDWLFGLIPPKRDYAVLNGTALVLGGVYLPTDSCLSNIVSVSPAHLIQDMCPIGQQFAEGTVLALVKPDERVTILRSGVKRIDAHWQESMKRAGFEIIAGVDEVICIGTGKALVSAMWLQEVFDWDDALLIASENRMSRLESSLVDCVYNRCDARQLVDEFYYHVYTQPNTLADELDGYDLIARTAGLRGEYFIVNRSSTDISILERVMIELATKLMVALYYMPDIKDSSGRGDPFGIERTNIAQLSSMIRIFPPKGI